MTRADALYRANTYEAQAAYYQWMVDHTEPGEFAITLAGMAATRSAWATQLRAEAGSAA